MHNDCTKLENNGPFYADSNCLLRTAFANSIFKSVTCKYAGKTLLFSTKTTNLTRVKLKKRMIVVIFLVYAFLFIQ